MSIMEYEFIALELVGHEVEWWKSLLADVPLWGNLAPSTALHCVIRQLFQLQRVRPLIKKESIYD